MANFSLNGAPIKKHRLFDFGGGLNTKFSNAILAENEASKLLNVVFTKRGSVRKRPGVKPLTTLPNKPGIPIIEILKSYHPMGDVQTVSIFSDGTLLARKNDETVFTEIILKDETDASVSHSCTMNYNGEKLTFASFDYNGVFYFGNRIDGWFKTDFAVDATSGSIHANKVVGIPNCDFAVIRNERAYYGRDVDNYSIVYFSQLGNVESVEMQIDPNTQTQSEAGGIFYFDSKESGVTGLEIFKGKVIIFKKDKVFVVHGDSYNDFIVRDLPVSTGCIAPGSITVADNYIYYLSYDGVRYLHSPFQDEIQSMTLSEKIAPDLENAEEIQKAFGFYHQSRYFLFLKTHTYVFEQTLQAWSKWDLTMNCIYFDEKLDKPILAGNTGYPYTLDNPLKDELTPGNETAIEAYYVTPYYHLNKPEATKRFKWLKVFIQPNAIPNSKIDIFINVDSKEQVKDMDAYADSLIWEDDGVAADDNMWGETWGDFREQISDLVRFGGSGEFIRIEFRNDKIDEDLGLNGFVLGYKEKSKVR